MKNLYLIKYGCSICSERLIVLADSFEDANEYAFIEAQNVYYSYDCNYPSEEDYEDYEDMTEEERGESEYQDMINDIFWIVENFDNKNEEHLDALKENDGIPFEV